MSSSGQEYTSVAVRTALLFANLTSNAFPIPTTCALVTMCPERSKTTPDPTDPGWLISTTDGKTA
ncbi:hypothetical protein GCM10009609_36510 [Pseudonocardia aurantiaca]